MELLATGLAVAWIALSLAGRVSEIWTSIDRSTIEKVAAHDGEQANKPEDELDAQQILNRLRRHCVEQTLLFGVMLLTLSRSCLRPLSEFGFQFSPFGRQVGAGAFATTLSWLPVLAIVFLTKELRTVERQHSVLRMLDEAPSLETWFWAVLAAVVIAPAVEELLYRVVLQGWLVTRLGAPAAIGITAVVFSAVHEFPDSLALLPLALILGCTYHFRYSFLTIAAAHALFNGTMLVVEALQQAA